MIDTAQTDWTGREIRQQPPVWQAIADGHVARSAALAAFLQPLWARADLRVVLTGAGTSAFVGECLAPALQQRTRRWVSAVATTEIVAAPAMELIAVPTLLVSFARSGNSPESVAAVQLAEQRIADCHHLIITCNADGALNRVAGTLRSAHVMTLPDETHDRSFAMTSSFTGMLLTAALAFGIETVDAVPGLTAAAQALLNGSEGPLPGMDPLAIARVVFLGSGPLRGLAREAALKMLELSDGRVVAVSESPLGFRHGPKTIVNDRTLVVVFLSSDPHTRRYDDDLLAELRRDGVAGQVLALTARERPDDRDTIRLRGLADAPPSDLALCLPYIVFAQCLARRQSLLLGLNPDSPNRSGVVHRVVQGVRIYPVDRVP